MSIAILSIFALLSVFSFLFFFWHRLKEDYSAADIFTTGFYAVFAAVGLGVASSKFFRVETSFWAALLGVLFGVTVGVIRVELRFFETIEAASLGFFSSVFLFLLPASIIAKNFYAGLLAVGSLVWFVVFFILDKRYKNFSWYKSGKIGFSGLTSLGGFFLTRALIALVSPPVIFFIGNLDAVISGVFAFLAFLAVYNLAREET